MTKKLLKGDLRTIHKTLTKMHKTNAKYKKVVVFVVLFGVFRNRFSKEYFPPPPTNDINHNPPPPTPPFAGVWKEFITKYVSYTQEKLRE